jgi:hypothetical protein
MIEDRWSDGAERGKDARLGLDVAERRRAARQQWRERQMAARMTAPSAAAEAA